MKRRLYSLVVVLVLLVDIVGAIPVSAKARTEAKSVVASDKLNLTVGEEFLLARAYTYEDNGKNETEIVLFTESGKAVVNADGDVYGIYEIPLLNCTFKVSNNKKVSVEKVKTKDEYGYDCYHYILKVKKKGSFSVKLSIKMTVDTAEGIKSYTDTYTWKGAVVKAKKSAKV